MPAADTNPADLSAREAARRIADGRLTSVALVQACLDRIERLEPGIGAWAYRDPQAALAAAQASDKSGTGPLRGLPVAVKDLIDTADMPTSYGSPIYDGHRPRADASVVALARAAGAVMLGKSVTTEFAALHPGKTRNPANLAHSPGGSSSGSAAAVASGMVPLAFGTQTAGSVIRPASYCGVVGFKPSYGLMPRAGVKSVSDSMDTIGVITRSVEDAGFFVGHLTGRPILADIAPAASAPPPAFSPTPWWAMAEPPVQAGFDIARRRFAEAGVDIAEIEAFPAFDGLHLVQKTIMDYETRSAAAWEIAHHPDKLSPRYRDYLRSAEAITPDSYDLAQLRTEAARAEAARFFGDFDAIIVPATVGLAPKGLDSTGDPLFNRLWTLLRGPAIALPLPNAGFELPLGLQLVAAPGEDARLLAAAAYVEAVCAHV